MLSLISTGGGGRTRQLQHRMCQAAVKKAHAAGFFSGKKVMIGNVQGTIVGYNVGGWGLYPGWLYPLLVDTPLGLDKCKLEEVRLA